MSPSPSKSSPSKSSPRKRNLTERSRMDDQIRQVVFGPVKEAFNKAFAQGILLDYITADLENPKVWSWPLDEDNQRIHWRDLDDAFRNYDIPHPFCACYSQEVGESPTSHPFHIRICKKYQSPYEGQAIISCQDQDDGCNLWGCLTQLYYNVDLVCVKYPRRQYPGRGLSRFNKQSLTAQSFDTNETEDVLPAAPSPFKSPIRKSGFLSQGGSRRLPKLNSPRIPLGRSQLSQPPPYVSRHSSPTPTISASSETDLFTSTPTTSETDLFASTPTTSETDYFATPTSVSTSLLSSSLSPSATPQPHISKTLPATNKETQPSYMYKFPCNRLAWDWGPLFEPPSPRSIFIKNVEIDALDPSQINDVLRELTSPEGVSSARFKQAFDYCDCERWFTRHYLYHEHARRCLDRQINLEICGDGSHLTSTSLTPTPALTYTAVPHNTPAPSVPNNPDPFFLPAAAPPSNLFDSGIQSLDSTPYPNTPYSISD